MNSVTPMNTVKKIKKIAKYAILSFLTAFALVAASTASAQSSSYGANTARIVYSVNSNHNWSDGIPTNCVNCDITISKGVTLTIDKAVTLQNCAFLGGTLSIKDLTLQFAGGN